MKDCLCFRELIKLSIVRACQLKAHYGKVSHCVVKVAIMSETQKTLDNPFDSNLNKTCWIILLLLASRRDSFV